MAAAFKVEHSTSIYSGIVRILDLALSSGDFQATAKLFLVAPDAREADVRAQLQRPAFRRVVGLDFSYLPYGELDKNREAIGRLDRAESHRRNREQAYLNYFGKG